MEFKLLCQGISMMAHAILQAPRPINIQGEVVYWYDIQHPSGRTGYAAVSYRKMRENIAILARDALLSHGLNDESKCGYIANFEPYAHSPRRKCGYGIKLLESIEIHARSLDAKCLVTLPTTEEYEEFISRHGFRKHNIWYKIL